jgi:hypothetical protein
MGHKKSAPREVGQNPKIKSQKLSRKAVTRFA